MAAHFAGVVVAHTSAQSSTAGIFVAGIVETGKLDKLVQNLKQEGGGKKIKNSLMGESWIQRKHLARLIECVSVAYLILQV